ncbi:MAG: sigma 54-interacting transcriptional regulator, partial [Terriglobia bacterium]
MAATAITTHHWIAQDPASVEILRTVDKVKDTPSTLLIQGESGTGKDLLASLIHHSSRRCDEPF